MPQCQHKSPHPSHQQRQRNVQPIPVQQYTYLHDMAIWPSIPPDWVYNHHSGLLEEEWVLDSSATANLKERFQFRESRILTYRQEADRWIKQEEAKVEEAMKQERLRIERAETRRKLHGSGQLPEAAPRRQQRLASRRESLSLSESKGIAEAWNAFEARWRAVSTSTTPLQLSDIAWPVYYNDEDVHRITTDTIRRFVLGRSRTLNVSRLTCVRACMLRFHPDRFQRVLDRVVDSDTAQVKYTAGKVARCLNELLRAEQKRVKRRPEVH